MTRAVFQAGLSWAAIETRWEAFRAAFAGFHAETVATFDEFTIDGLMDAPGLIHSRKKIVGSIANARTLLRLAGEFGSVDAYAASFRRYADLFADVRERFAFVGDLSCYYWLFRTGNRVPLFETWIAGQAADHPRMREMVLAGRAAQSSSEDPQY